VLIYRIAAYGANKILIEKNILSSPYVAIAWRIVAYAYLELVVAELVVAAAAARASPVPTALSQTSHNRLAAASATVLFSLSEEAVENLKMLCAARTGSLGGVA
jgi:hypothetical protein